MRKDLFMKVRKISISIKLVIGVLLIFLLSDLCIGFIVYNKSKGLLENQIKDSALNIASCAAASIDPALFVSVEPGDEEGSENYETIRSALSVFFDNAGVEYVYSVKANTISETLFDLHDQIYGDLIIVSFDGTFSIKPFFISKIRSTNVSKSKGFII